MKLINQVQLSAAELQVCPKFTELIEQLEKVCFSESSPLVVKDAAENVAQARLDMVKEREKYYIAKAIHSEATALLEDYQEAKALAVDRDADLREAVEQAGLWSDPEVYETLARRLSAAEAAQRLRLPEGASLKPDEAQEESNGIPKGVMTGDDEHSAHHMLGVRPEELLRSQLDEGPFSQDSATFQAMVIPEIEARLRAKVERLESAFAAGSSGTAQSTRSSSLPDRVAAAVAKLSADKAAELDEYYAADRRFTEYYNVLEQMLGVLLRMAKEYKLDHQHRYDLLRTEWLCRRCQTMHSKLRVMEFMLLRDTYNGETVPALHIVRNHLLRAMEDATAAHTTAVTRLREFQGFDERFDEIATEYRELTARLQEVEWTLAEVERDLEAVDYA
ncbi:hypothetical protein KFL_000370160 [Klebsormidium nitens]|uniref:HAUS augmin-like complex subunit 4 n=1 Tax=Klebsormidium nitens TaxID=105231 RepID=A0A1Y1HPP7_KLENI|nr:hypothetical protein KFL_000370160 [Klebsormidium nitens]|eukprot:GAQ79742.1 hypothetical protein KFL_000370160 [Klebsormidium nitens]